MYFNSLKTYLYIAVLPPSLMVFYITSNLQHTTTQCFLKGTQFKAYALPLLIKPEIEMI